MRLGMSLTMDRWDCWRFISSAETVFGLEEEEAGWGSLVSGIYLRYDFLNQ